MEELARMVAASMDRHGCDTSIDHRRLNIRFQGRDFRLTDVSGNVVEEIIG